MREGKKVGITYGTFDTLHRGHVRLLERARAECDFLIVAVSSDAFNASKGKKPSTYPEEDRRYLVESLRCVDMVITEDNWAQKTEDIVHYGVDVFFMGDDWKGKFDYLSKFCKVVYLPRTNGISSSGVKDAIATGNRISPELPDEIEEEIVVEQHA